MILKLVQMGKKGDLSSLYSEATSVSGNDFLYPVWIQGFLPVGECVTLQW